MKKQLLIVMDLGSFKAYTIDNSPLNTTPRLELIEHFTPEEPHRKIADKLSDLAGRYRAPGAKGGSPWGDRHITIPEGDPSGNAASKVCHEAERGGPRSGPCLSR